ncbi:MAG: hypothetical protein ACREOE_19310 [Gemmatimonadales bacterium]
MRLPLRLTSILVASTLLLGACSGATATPTPAPAATAAVTTPAPTAAAGTIAPTSGPEQTAVATSLDPCQLVTSAEASSLAGTTFGAGAEDTTSGNARTCTYGAQTLNVFNVLVAQAPDATTAQDDWAQEQAEAQAYATQSVPAGVTLTFNLTDVTNVAGADQAAVGTAQATISGQTINLSAIYVLKGAVFFTFSDLVLGNPAPSASVLEAQAVTTISRLP